MSLTDLPHHKAGLWRNTMTIEGMQQPMPVTEMCMDAASEAKMSVLTKTLRDRRCASESLSRNLDGSMSFKSTCDMGAGGHKESTGTIVGDMTTNYKMSLDSKTTGAASLGMNGETKMTIASVWLGPCAAGQKGGDVIMPGGKVVNMGQ
ncbi:MAG: DUF3617 family protein [Novosphingobium sp.]